MGTLALVAASAAVAATGVLVASCLRLRSATEFLVAVYVVASAEIVTIALLLSPSDWLTRNALLLVIGCAAAAAAVVWIVRGTPRPPVSRALLHSAREALRDPAVAVLAALALLVYLYALVVALTLPQSLPDTMLYHLPRAALWKQQHAVANVANAPDFRINFFPPGAEIETVASMILSGGDRYVALPQFAALLALCTAVVGVARRLGLGYAASAFGALVFATSTVVVLQTPTALNDLVVAALLGACAYFALGTSSAELGLAALALALAVGTKLTTEFALPALIAFVLSAQPRRRWLPLYLAATIGAAVGSFWFVIDLVARTGAGDEGGADGGSVGVLERIRLLLVDLFELSNVDGKHLLASPIPGLVLLAVAVVGAVLLFSYGRRQVAAAVVLTGVFAALALPLLTTWVRVADHGFGQARAALGLGAAPTGPRLPNGYYESAMYSSFGLAFVLLYLGTGALVAAAVARRTVPVSALLALVGLPLTVVLVAVGIVPDPQRMRYVIFPAALASAAFGIGLRLRWLAWAAVGLSAATLAVLVAYFIPRPASFALLPGDHGAEHSTRWFIQAEGGGGDLDSFHFLAEKVPQDATIAMAVTDNTYVYPAWDAHLRRKVLFVRKGGTVPREAGWLVVGPSEPMDVPQLASSGWRLRLASSGGWRILQRVR